MDEIGIIPRFGGILCHEHWKPNPRENTVYNTGIY